jgi:hypothetical protein
MIILIDNGHGIDTAGKCSPDKSLREYKWAREIAMLLCNFLKDIGYDAQLIVPEETDVSLKERCRRVNAICDKEGKDNVLFVSIHSNAAGADGKWKTAGGWCIYTSPGQTKSDILATEIWNAAKEWLNPYINRFPLLQRRGEYDSKQQPIRADWSDGDPDYEARFTVLTGTKCAAVLTESLFQDNKADVEFLLSDEGKNAIVRLHADGIIKYIKSMKR